MLDTVARYLAGIAENKDAYTLRRILEPLADRYSSQMLSTAGLVIKAGGGVLAKTGAAACYGVASGKMVTIAGGTDMPALTGNTIAANSFNVFCFFIDSASVVTLAAGTAATTIAGIVWPQFPVGNGFGRHRGQYGGARKLDGKNPPQAAKYHFFEISTGNFRGFGRRRGYHRKSKSIVGG